MSYKVYDAWKLDNKQTLSQIISWCTRVAGPVLRQKMFEELRGFVSKHELASQDNHRSIYIDHYWSCVGIQKEIINPKLEGVFIPSGKDCLLVLYYKGPYSYRNVMDTLARPWGYWTTTDPDDDVSNAEWRARRKDWTKALKDSGVPSEVGVSFTLIPSTMPFPSDLYPNA